ncbi:MAG: type III polyketide synthase [Bacteroidetes bacterium]|nr:type III polyketide synthase [Bacteroidota bacterium]MDA1118902.1 type III polyketide synthase [Bacteroidota bacterium]
MAHITSIGTANPGNAIAQGKIADFMIKGLGLSKQESQNLRVLYRATGIHSRYSVIADYALNGKPYEFYPKTPGLEPFPSIKARMDYFQKSALDLSIQAIDNCFNGSCDLNITHLITVSCTGMYAPGLDIEIVTKLGLSPNIERTAINFMGCYAAFNALKIANRVVETNTNAKVLIVCVELCSLHFQKTPDKETALANSLFSDGAAAVLVQSESNNEFGLKLNKFHCDIEPKGKKEMTWSIGDFGFEMRLSDKVPKVIESKIKRLTGSLLNQLNLSIDDIEFFAIHPGGKRILDVVEEQLEIPHQKNLHSFKILRDYGNMSSPSVLFVLASILKSLKSSDRNKNVLSFAFGPGLTLESMLLKVV